MPARTCVGCRTGDDKRALVRFVRTPEGDVEVDPTGKANGRGAYTCPALDCFDKAIRTRKLASALRVKLDEYDIDRLRADFERAIADAPKPARTVN
jgi:uncharacterized protein